MSKFAALCLYVYALCLSLSLYRIDNQCSLLWAQLEEIRMQQETLIYKVDALTRLVEPAIKRFDGGEWIHVVDPCLPLRGRNEAK